MAEKGWLLLARIGREVLSGVRHRADKGFARDPLLFVTLLGSTLAAVAFVMVGKVSVAMLFCLLAVLVCVGLWIGDGSEVRRSEGLGQRQL
jgi:hypothetical protein